MVSMRIMANKTESKQSSVLELSASEWMLCLLYVDNASPIRGKTAFVKELFVVGKELFRQVDRVFGFYPHRFGPYSKEFEVNLSKLIANGCISESSVRVYIDQQPDKVRSDYALLPRGLDEASRIVSRLSEMDRLRLAKYKRFLSNMGFWGLIHYVYSNYPEYTIASEIAAGTPRGA